MLIKNENENTFKKSVIKLTDFLFLIKNSK
ncbi:MAG: hypothetical protein [Wendovervirus sonii]|uniref:Uncharacterized protein n=1 Tax=phage Lak_Megaphage_Sonny TaxID=3109229 RepID=A0ABZ0Z374_9CAUD|nr:MAG: hypothetical protein [phage Lak_Megaphage_Sonny]